MKVRKTWKEKLNDSKDLPRLEVIPDRLEASWGAGKFVIPAPREVDELMRRVPKGKVTTINHIRAALAKKHRANATCPLTTGIFAWIAANAAEEETGARPKARVTPYWRTLKAGGVLNEKYPGGIEQQQQRLEAEGHAIIKKGKHKAVKNIDNVTFDFGAS